MAAATEASSCAVVNINARAKLSPRDRTQADPTAVFNEGNGPAAFLSVSFCLRETGGKRWKCPFEFKSSILTTHVGMTDVPRASRIVCPKIAIFCQF